MTFSLSPEQLLAAEVLTHKPTSDIKYFDIQTALRAAYRAIITHLQNDKKVLIHIPESCADRHRIIKYIKSTALDSLMVDVSNNQSIPEADIITIRSILKKQIDTSPIVNQLLLTEQLADYQDILNEYYHALDKKILSEIPFRDFIISKIYNDHEKKTSSLTIVNSTLDFSANEYYQLRRNISQASSYYRAEFDIYDRLGILNEQLWIKTKSEIEEAKKKITSLAQRGINLLHDYNTVFGIVSKDAESDATQRLDRLNSALKKQYEACIAHHIKKTYRPSEKDSKFSLFSKKNTKPDHHIYINAYDQISAMVKGVSSEWYDNLHAPETDAITYEYIMDFISTTKGDIDLYFQKVRKSIINSLHRINRINTDSDDVKSLDQKLTDFIADIEHTQIVNIKYNSNTLSFTKQMDVCAEISSTLDHCATLMDNGHGYTRWKELETNHGTISTQIIHQLKHFPKEDWVVAFDNWYNEQIVSSVLSNKETSEKKVETVKQLHYNLNDCYADAITNRLLARRSEAADALKKSSKDLYNSLFKKKAPQAISWQEIAMIDSGFLQSFFPLHISHTLTNAQQYDSVISFERRPEKSDRNLPTHHISSILKEDMDTRSKSDDVFLYLNEYEYNQPLSELPHTERLKAAKKLAKFILSLNQQVKIYQIKSGNIISLLPSHDDSHLEKQLEPYGIKTIDMGESLYEKLTESILYTERQPYLIIKDQLINPELHEHLLWQADVMITFRQAGYKILSINTSAQIKSNSAVYDKIVNELADKKHNQTTAIPEISATSSNNQELV